jgi:hypothetical protein
LVGRWRIPLFAIAILLLGALITLLSGEMLSEPWLVVVDVAQVAVGALLGAFALPFAFRLLRSAARPAAH